MVNSNLAPDTTLSHYRIISKIGAGGMGEVYLAEDVTLGRKVALKILPESVVGNEDRMRRFVQEAKSASALNHPNLITIHEIGEADGRHFIASEYIIGETVRQLLYAKELVLPQAIRIAEQAAFALSVAHSGSVVHRDIKPENIMVRRDGIVKVLDFGLAKLIADKPQINSSDDETKRMFQTAPGVIMGTATYMSPEQARGKPTDARSDIW